MDQSNVVIHLLHIVQVSDDCLAVLSVPDITLQTAVSVLFVPIQLSQLLRLNPLRFRAAMALFGINTV